MRHGCGARAGLATDDNLCLLTPASLDHRFRRASEVLGISAFRKSAPQSMHGAQILADGVSLHGFGQIGPAGMDGAT